jgi:hypothetical protein
VHGDAVGELMSYASVEELAQVLRIRVTPENTDALQRPVA